MDRTEVTRHPSLPWFADELGWPADCKPLLVQDNWDHTYRYVERHGLPGHPDYHLRSEIVVLEPLSFNYNGCEWQTWTVGQPLPDGTCPYIVPTQVSEQWLAILVIDGCSVLCDVAIVSAICQLDAVERAAAAFGNPAPPLKCQVFRLRELSPGWLWTRDGRSAVPTLPT